MAVYDERQSLDFQIKGQSSMQYISHYESPLGAITLAADEKGLTEKSILEIRWKRSMKKRNLSF